MLNGVLVLVKDVHFIAQNDTRRALNFKLSCVLLVFQSATPGL